MTIAERIKRRREQLGLSQEDLARKLGYRSRSSITKIEKEASGLPQQKIAAIAKALDTTPGYIMGWEDAPALNLPPVFRPVKLRKVPMLGNVACGEPILAVEEKEVFVFADADIKADFCLTAKGDSMINARIFNGDTVFIKAMPEVENGDIAAVIIGDEATLKRVYYYPEENKIALVPENPLYKVQYYQGKTLDQIRIVGKAVALQTEVH